MIESMHSQWERHTFHFTDSVANIYVPQNIFLAASCKTWAVEKTKTNPDFCVNVRD